MPASHLLKVQRECPDCGDVSFETSVKEQSFLYGTGADEVWLVASSSRMSGVRIYGMRPFALILGFSRPHR
jgi:hypothetical protein